MFALRAAYDKHVDAAVFTKLNAARGAYLSTASATAGNRLAYIENAMPSPDMIAAHTKLLPLFNTPRSTNDAAYFFDWLESYKVRLGLVASAFQYQQLHRHHLARLS